MTTTFDFVPQVRTPAESDTEIARFNILTNAAGKATFRMSFRRLAKDMTLNGVTFQKGDIDPRWKRSAAVLQFLVPDDPQNPNPNAIDGMILWGGAIELLHARTWNKETRKASYSRMSPLLAATRQGEDRAFDPTKNPYAQLNVICRNLATVDSTDQSEPAEANQEVEDVLESVSI